MQLLSISSLVSLSLLALAACGGGDPLDPGAGDDPGSGTNTLFVEGRVHADPAVPNSQRASDFRSEISVRITLNDAPVTTGTVTITSRFADTPLTFDAADGRWKGNAAGYDEVYQLDVVSGADKIEGVIVDGPDLHTVTKPTAGAQVDSTVANDLAWDREETADVITFRAGEIDRITITDSGTYSIPPGSFKADKDQVREDEIELRRSNDVVPSGAVAGSRFTVTIEQRLQVLVAPNPAL